MYEIAVWNSLHRLAGFAPGDQPTSNHKSFETLFPQEICHTGARYFALSSAVKVDVLVPGKFRDFLGKFVRLDSNRTSYPRGTGIVVTMASDSSFDRAVSSGLRRRHRTNNIQIELFQYVFPCDGFQRRELATFQLNGCISPI